MTTVATDEAALRRAVGLAGTTSDDDRRRWVDAAHDIRALQALSGAGDADADEAHRTLHEGGFDGTVDELRDTATVVSS